MSENWTYQYSGKAGADMLNVRAETAKELFGALDELFGDGTGETLVKKFFVTQAFNEAGFAVVTPPNVTTTPLSQTSGGARSGDQPSEKQIAFAGKLGIQGSAGMSKRELSAAIDAKTKK
jgi:hypothetical protein